MSRVLDATTNDEEFVFSYGVVPKKLLLPPPSPRAEARFGASCLIACPETRHCVKKACYVPM